MSNFFELNESKKKSLSISELSDYAERFNIDMHKISEKSGKKINKKKEELINELNAVYLKNKIKEKKRIEEKVSKSSKLLKNDLNKPKLIGNYPNENKLFINDTNYKTNMLNNQKYIEEKYKIKLEFGNIIYYGDFYIWNNEKFIYIESYEKNNIIHLIISRNFTKYVNDSIKYFENIENKNQEIFIDKIELSINDKYLNNLDFDVNELVGINFNYIYKYTNYQLEIEMNYMNNKGEIDKKFPTYSFIYDKNISILKIIDFQYKLSMHQFEFSFKLEEKPEFDINPQWTSNILVKNKQINFGNSEKNIKSSYQCIIYCNMYDKFKNEEIIKSFLINELNYNQLLLINNKKEFLIMKDLNNFDEFIEKNLYF